MNDSILLIPMALILGAAGLAGVFGLPPINRRLKVSTASWLLSMAPLAAGLILLSLVPELNGGRTYAWNVSWLPTYGLTLGFYLDSLALLFALLVTFIGFLIVVYSGQYFKGDQSAWRFLTYLLLFMSAMLGLVMAGDVLTLFIFWEGTSIFSYLLVAYKTQDETARRGAFRALFITGGGGIALLAGLLFVSQASGGTDWNTILHSGDALRQSEFYLVMLALVAFGAFTKSAQFPAHIWLPGAMSAPTPASAYLHSATMVKAGIYLLARFNPVLGFTESWFWLLTITGGITMLAGAYLGLKQNDLKGLLAYSTISQLGVLMMLIGQDIPQAYKALVIGVVAHALYKSALFMAVGIVDHETGTRDLRRLGGLRRAMPFTFIVTSLAALSMAGLPPMFGFLAKETLLATAVHPSLPPVGAELIRWGAVVAGAFLLAQAAMLVVDTFLGRPRDPSIKGHEAPWPMWLAPAVPASLSILFSLLPEPKEEATFLAGAAQDAFGLPVKVNTVLFNGLTVELLLSIVAISLGFVLFVYRRPIRARQERLAPGLSFNALYGAVLRAIDWGGHQATRLQVGRLRFYLATILIGAAALVLGLGWRGLLPSLAGLSMMSVDFSGEVAILRLFTLLATVGAALSSVLLRRDFSAIIALGVSGLGMAVLFVLEPAPDVALVQIVVDLLAMVILVLALTRLPRSQRRQAQGLSDRELTTGLRIPRSSWRDALIALVIGAIVASITLTALLDRPRESILAPFYASNAKSETGASDIVGAIVVDFRALDTLIEIAVFSLAGLGIYMLLRYAARQHGDHGEPGETAVPAEQFHRTQGIGGKQLSPLIRAPAFVVLPLAIVLAISHMMYGHDQPGDGFTAGVIVSLAVGLWFVVFGYARTRRRLPWLHAPLLIGVGVLLAIATGLIAAAMTGQFLGNVDIGELADLTLPGGFHISTSFLIELAIGLSVLGSATLMLGTLGHPEFRDAESRERLRELAERGEG